MRTIIAIIFGLLSGIVINAQSNNSESNLLFENFMQGSVKFKNKPVTQAMLNYDMLKQEMLFLDGQNQMILQELHTIDTIYIGDRKFIPKKNIFIEERKTASTLFYIEWKVSAFSKIKEDGVGLISHGGGSEALNVSRIQTTGEAEAIKNIIHLYKFNNTYHIPIDNKLRKFSTIQGFMKLYSKEQAAKIQQFASEKKINIQQPEEVLQIINYTDIITERE